MATGPAARGTRRARAPPPRARAGEAPKPRRSRAYCASTNTGSVHLSWRSYTSRMIASASPLVTSGLALRTLTALCAARVHSNTAPRESGAPPRSGCSAMYSARCRPQSRHGSRVARSSNLRETETGPQLHPRRPRPREGDEPPRDRLRRRVVDAVRQRQRDRVDEEPARGPPHLGVGEADALLDHRADRRVGRERVGRAHAALAGRVRDDRARAVHERQRAAERAQRAGARPAGPRARSPPVVVLGAHHTMMILLDCLDYR